MGTPLPVATANLRRDNCNPFLRGEWLERLDEDDPQEELQIADLPEVMPMTAVIALEVD